jgi:outer membrane protein OmpA-like peptidoglycan-associated protein
MQRTRGLSLVVVWLASLGTAQADTTQLGAWFGPRLFTEDSQLGYIDDAPEHPALENAFSFGLRVARPFLPWLVPELELAMAPTKTTRVRGAGPVDVFWIDPRLHLRLELRPGMRLAPFVVVGGGSPISISSARQTFATSIIGDGYVGGGLRFDSTKGFTLRFDARVALTPGVEDVVVPEVEIGFGIEVGVGRARRTPAGKGSVKVATPLADRDGDKLADDKDQCPDRPEDFDEFEDTDGCPDIDNDLDRVLDIADKCPGTSESYNGFEDDDGCPDIMPGELEGLRGPIDGLLYAEAETQVRASALGNLGRLAKLIGKYPTIRIVLVGFTDDREAKQFANPGTEPDLVALSADLSRARADAVKQALVAAGLAATRIDVEGHGAEEPTGDNATPRGRLANRRVELKLYLPPSAPH